MFSPTSPSARCASPLAPLRNLWCLFVSCGARLELARCATLKAFAQLINNFGELINCYRTSEISLVLNFHKLLTCHEWDAPAGSYIIIPVNDASLCSAWIHLAALIVGESHPHSDSVKGLRLEMCPEFLELSLWTAKADPIWHSDLLQHLAAVLGDSSWLEFVRFHALPSSTAAVAYPSSWLSALPPQAGMEESGSVSPAARRYDLDTILAIVQSRECKEPPVNVDGTDWSCLVEAAVALTRQMLFYHDAQSTAASMLKQAFEGESSGGDDFVGELGEFCVAKSAGEFMLPVESGGASVAGAAAGAGVSSTSAAAAAATHTVSTAGAPSFLALSSCSRSISSGSASPGRRRAASLSAYPGEGVPATSMWSEDQHLHFGEQLRAGAFTGASSATASSSDILMQTTTTLRTAGALVSPASPTATAVPRLQVGAEASVERPLAIGFSGAWTATEWCSPSELEVPKAMVERASVPLFARWLHSSTPATRIAMLQNHLAGNVFLEIACDPVGVDSLHALLSHMSTAAECSAFQACLTPHIQQIGTHVHAHQLLLYFFQHSLPHDNAAIVEVLTQNCRFFASDRHGLKVVKAVLSTQPVRAIQPLLAEIAKQTLALSEDQFGNYVLQLVLGIGYSRAGDSIVAQLRGRIALLSSRKFSSNVVEACLRGRHEAWADAAMAEVIAAAGNLVCDRYGNYVLQTALSIACGSRAAAAAADAMHMGAPGAAAHDSSAAMKHERQVVEIAKAVRPVLGTMRHNVRVKWQNLLKDAEQRIALRRRAASFG